MKILIINQPLNNRGDEAAHKALIRTILKEVPDAEITVLFEYDASKNSISQYAVKSNRVKYVCHKPTMAKGFRKVSQYGLKTKRHFLWYLHPGIRSWMEYFKMADYVICAPGGINMGGFQSWYHLFNLYCAKIYDKPTAYYGRSIGPFPMQTVDNRRFKETSLDLLHYFSYISIRDKKSEGEMSQIGIPFHSVVDTAFLEIPRVNVPDDLKKKIGMKPYIVFVPNLLIWHYMYKSKATKDTVALFYIDILNCLFDYFPGYNIVMLPQTFNYKSCNGNDINFFNYIQYKKNDDRIIVVPDVYSSDVQQTIISDAQFLIGARYHSIVFAINNAVPFIALSYEHKISGLLDTLGVNDSCIDIQKVFDSSDEKKQVLNRIVEILKSGVPQKDYSLGKKAQRIAWDGFLSFKQNLLKTKC